MTITALPTPPSRQSPSDFSDKADAFLSALPTFVTECNATAVAMNLNDTTSTSTTSLTIGVGSKSLTVETTKSFQVGMSVKIAHDSTNWMHGEVTSYNSGTGALVVNVTSTMGSGTETSWTITLSGPSVFLSVSDALDIIGSTPGKYLARGSDTWDVYNLDQLKPISASVGSNNLTLSTSSMLLDFRSATLTSGSITSGVAVGAQSLVVPSGATLGTINATQSQLVLIILYNSGNPELGVVNLSGGINLDETTLLSTTAISSAADSAGVIYSTNAITNSPFRVVGYVSITETTAGTWATAPTLVQGSGGQALAALSSLGYGQTWQDVTGSRSLGTTYYNTTGRPIKIRMYGSGSSTSYAGYITLTINGTDVVFLASSSTSGANQVTDEILIPPGASYVAAATHASVYNWYELR